MATLWIHDLDGTGLAFDLIDLLELLAPQSVQTSWTISTVKSIDPKQEWFEAQGEAGEKLEDLAEQDAEISVEELIKLARGSYQVIWGEFLGASDDPQMDFWVIIRAMDSSFYEIVTFDEAVIGKITSHFHDVRHGDTPIGLFYHKL